MADFNFEFSNPLDIYTRRRRWRSPRVEIVTVRRYQQVGEKGGKKKQEFKLQT